MANQVIGEGSRKEASKDTIIKGNKRKRIPTIFKYIERILSVQLKSFRMN